MNYWLMKSEPDVFGIDHLKSRPRKTEHWDGVRNYQARNMMRDDMQIGDEVFFSTAPKTVPEEKTRAIPKSVTLTWSALSSIRLAGLMSR